MFWRVRYLPDGLMDGREQMLSFVQTVTLFMNSMSPFCHGQFVSISHSGCFHPFMVEQKASTGVGGARRRAGGRHVKGWSCSASSGTNCGDRFKHLCSKMCVCIYMHIQLEGILLSLFKRTELAQFACLTISPCTHSCNTLSWS